MKSTYLTSCIWVLGMLACLPSFAQESDTTHYDRNEIACDADSAYFYRITKKISSLQDVQEYYAANNQLKAEFARIYDSYYYVNHGEFKGFHENGQLAKEANYDHGRGVDTTREWYDNGQEFAIWTYDEEGKRSLQQGWYKDGKDMIREGAGQYEEFYPDGKVKVQGKVSNGLQAGTWKAFHENGQVLQQFTVVEAMYSGKEEIWDAKGNTSYEYNHAKKGEVESYSYWDKEGNIVYESGVFVNEYGSDVYWRDHWGKLEPQPVNMDVIRRSIGYPAIARDAGIQGQVIVRAKVNVLGEVDSVRLVKGVHPILNELVVKNTSDIKFTPAIIDGALYPFWVNIPFRFKLMNGSMFPKKEKKKKKRRRN